MRATLGAIAALLTTLLLLECGARALVETGWLEAPRPAAVRHRFWQGDHPEFGVWHAPNSVFVHRSRCFEVEYRTNSAGARDIERAPRSERPRVVVLGDSFLEGWGVPDGERFSNVLEARTGLEHLNFAMSHFGTYQEYLVYRSLAKRFDHDAVLVGVLPENDFLDIDLELALQAPYYRFHYRPYLVAEGSELRPFHHREPRWRHALRHWSYAGGAVIALGEMRARKQDFEAGGGSRARDWFYDYGERQARMLEAILARLAAEAQGKLVAVVLIPTFEDLESYRRNGPDPLSGRLRAAGDRVGYRVVNLLPKMASDDRGGRRYFLPCDYHWSALGNAVAAELVEEALASELYAR